MCRSEVVTQRAVALRALHGILIRRDEVVALEAYGHSDCPQQSSSRQWDQLRISFAELVSTISNMISAIHPVGISTGAGSGSGATTPASSTAIPTTTATTTATKSHVLHKIGNVLVSAFLLLCASDFPVGVPTVLLLGPDAAPTKRQNRVQYLKCLQGYLFCSTEEAVAEVLWMGMWGVFGCPHMPCPHTRREELSYEEHVALCETRQEAVIQGADEVYQEQETEAAPRPERSPHEELALRCRWGRVDVMMQANNALLIKLLRTVAKEGIAAAEDGRMSRSGNGNGGSNSAGAGPSHGNVQLLQAGVFAMEILSATARVCSETLWLALELGLGLDLQATAGPSSLEDCRRQSLVLSDDSVVCGGDFCPSCVEGARLWLNGSVGEDEEEEEDN
eukprot:gene41042-54367_t